MSSDRTGFTVVELVLTVLIISILSAVAAPKFLDTYHRSRVESAATRIKVDLNYAREIARSRSTTQTMQFFPTSDRYVLYGINGLNQSSTNYVVELSHVPYEVDLFVATFGAGRTVIFDLYGRPDLGGSITVKSGGHQKTVVVDASTGEVAIP